jgi:hypothetical protein
MRQSLWWRFLQRPDSGVGRRGLHRRALDSSWPQRAPKPLAAERLLALWAQLADGNAGKAYDALWTLAAVPRQALPFLEEHLKPDSTADGRRVAMLIADLESDQFAVRVPGRQAAALPGVEDEQPLLGSPRAGRLKKCCRSSGRF